MRQAIIRLIVRSWQLITKNPPPVLVGGLFCSCEMSCIFVRLCLDDNEYRFFFSDDGIPSLRQVSNPATWAATLSCSVGAAAVLRSLRPATPVSLPGVASWSGRSCVHLCPFRIVITLILLQ